MPANDEPFSCTGRPEDPSANPWAAPKASGQPQRPARLRAAQRQRAAHDPLLCPSMADVGMLSRAAARRAEHGLLESIGDAVSSPLPRSETFMIGVRADSDVVSQDMSDAVDGADCSSDERNVTGQCASLGAAPLYGLAITQSCKCVGTRSANPLAIPKVVLPAALNNEAATLVEVGSGDPMAEADADSSSAPHYSSCRRQASLPRSLPPARSVSPQLAMRTIKMIRHCIRAADTLEGISVQYGISASDLKRLNRLWQPSEMATRRYLYIPLRMCLPKFSVANIAHINARHSEALRTRQVPTVSPIDLVE
ncbi:hypothetical protein H4S01_004599, partial [Coemansia sp. RSA 2610]